MYRLSSAIQPEPGPSTIPDVAFQPGNRIFAATFKDTNSVKLFDADAHKELRSYDNPQAQLDWPHGVILTARHMIVSNKHNPTNQPSILNVYRLDDPRTEPVCRFVTPYGHLREAHSLALHGDKLLVTYCGNAISALVCYRFDDDTGQIQGPLDKVEAWFHEHGEPKGVCFNGDGTRAIVTFVTPKPQIFRHKLARSLRMAGREKKGIRRLLRLALGKLTGARASKKLNLYGENILSNGLALFDVDARGHISSEPVKLLPQKDFCRLENINLVKDKLIVADPINNEVRLYRLEDNVIVEPPQQIINDMLRFPHDACLSSDLNSAVIANHGISISNGVPQWGKFLSPRQDRLLVFNLEPG